MKMNGTKKLLAWVLALVMMWALAACGQQSTPQDDAADADSVQVEVPVADGAVIGEGAVSFGVQVQGDGESIVAFTVNTDEETVGAALMELGVLDGDMEEYGLYVKTVNGTTVDPDTENAYWAFYINGEYAMTGVDSTPIEADAVYMFCVESF